MNEEEYKEIITITKGIYLEDIYIPDVDTPTSLILISNSSTQYIYHLYHIKGIGLNYIDYYYNKGTITFNRYKNYKYSIIDEDYIDLINTITHKNHLLNYKNSDSRTVGILKKMGVIINFSSEMIPINHIITHLDL